MDEERRKPMIDFANASMQELLVPEGIPCTCCGKTHQIELRALELGAGAVRRLPQVLRSIGAQKPFVVSDANTFQAAGSLVLSILDEAGIPYAAFTYPPREGHMEPDEAAVGALTMAFDPSCDLVLAVGSGVLNDCCRVLAWATRLRSAVVATAPSMDGYASNSSSMIVRGVKDTLAGACPVAVIADTDILKEAPLRMLQAGFGDMVAKYISICEWRMSHLVTGEYYCENVARLVRRSLAAVRASAEGLTRREPAAIEAVMEGLVLSGVAMGFARISRPASGLEHYFSHIWEMQALQRGNEADLHGIQVGVGTLLTLDIYDTVRLMQPSRAQADQAFSRFSNELWEDMMRRVFGALAPELIEAEHERYHKNSPQKHGQRLDALLDNWAEILRIIQEELPPREELIALFQALGMPLTPEDLGVAAEDVDAALIGSREIRDKYLSSSMLWDLGLLDRFRYAGQGHFAYQE